MPFYNPYYGHKHIAWYAIMTYILKLIKNLILSVIGFAILFLTGFFIYVGIIIAWTPPSALPINGHDAIIVLTGDKGRIEKSFELLLDKTAPVLLISGVLKNSTHDNIIDNNSSRLSNYSIQDLKNHCCIVLDEVAITTETNANESARWMKENHIKSIILVTSDYHMPRSYMQFHKAVDNDIMITPFPVRNQPRLNHLFSRRFWHYSAIEYIKFGGTIIRLEHQNAF